MVGPNVCISLYDQVDAMLILSLGILLSQQKSSQSSDWNGLYGGVSVGARQLYADWQTTDTFCPCGGAIPFASVPVELFEDRSVAVSGFVGYNWQPSPTRVFGLEFSASFAENEDRTERIPGLSLFGTNPSSFSHVKAEWDTSIRLRAGILANPSLLIYATGGISFQRFEATATCPADTFVCNPAFGTQSFTNSDTLIGWTVGAGVEAMLRRNWLMRAEYLYANYGKFNFTAFPYGPTRFGAEAEADVSTHSLSVGLAYKFQPVR